MGGNDPPLPAKTNVQPVPIKQRKMMDQKRTRFTAAASVAAALLATAPVHAEMSATELAKLAQNPVGNLISVPFQNNTNLNFGPDKGTPNSGYYNVVHPDNGSNWQIRAQVQFMFPK